MEVPCTPLRLLETGLPCYPRLPGRRAVALYMPLAVTVEADQVGVEGSPVASAHALSALYKIQVYGRGVIDFLGSS